MSFLTEYFDEFREHPIRKTVPCRPEQRFVTLEGKWLDPKLGKEDKEHTDEERREFIKTIMKNLRGQSMYYTDYCAHLPEDLKTRPHVERPKKKRPCHSTAGKEEEEAPPPSPIAKLDITDTELMKVAKEMYERDPDAPTLRPLDTHPRILGYVRPSLYHTGLSDYQGGIARVAYEMIRDKKMPRYYAHNGGRPKWGFPPEGTRQPELDVIPYEGERLY